MKMVFATVKLNEKWKSTANSQHCGMLNMEKQKMQGWMMRNYCNKFGARTPSEHDFPGRFAETL
jgi:hypothetical protein